MKYHKLKSIYKQTDNKYLNMYLAKYETENGEKKYQFASRRNEEDLSAYLEQDKADAIKVLPYFKANNKINVVLIKEFRYPINKFIYGITAGIVEAGESEEETVKKELKEEIGAETISIKKTDNISYSSAGMTDETLSCFEAEVKLTGFQLLEKHEDIN